MAIFNSSGMNVGWCVGHVPPHSLSATLIVKGTFQLQRDKAATLLPQQDFLSGDLHEDADPAKSLRYPSDFAWYKPRADLLLVGSCHLPRPSSVCRVTFQVGRWYKQLVVVGDRTQRTRFWFFSSVTDPLPFRSVKLAYERSYGGPGYPKNPVGCGYRDESPGLRSLPNIQEPDRIVVDPDSRPDPAGFGPLALPWAQRQHGLGTYDRAWLQRRWPGFPADFDGSAWNAAPSDQQLPSFLRGDEKLFFEHLHPDHAVYPSRLPAIRPRWFLHAGKRTLREVPLDLDTLWVDMDAERLVLVWRGVVGIQHRKMREMADHIVVTEPLTGPPADPQPFLPVSEPAPQASPETVAPRVDRKAETVARLAALYDILKVKAPRLAEKVGPPPTMEEPWTRERCRGKTDFRNQDLSGVDLGGLAFPHALFSGARMVNCRFEGADLSGAVLENADLRGAHLRKALLHEADLTGANLIQADLTQAVLDGADLSETKLVGAILSGASAKQATFFGADLSQAKLCDAVLTGAELGDTILNASDLSRADLREASAMKAQGRGLVLADADLSGFKTGEGADFTQGNFRSVRGAKSVWEEAVLDEADFTKSVLPDSNFTGVSAKRGVFAYSDLRRSRFADANLEGANLLRVNLFRSDFEGARLNGAQFHSSNLYEAEFWKASTEGAGFEQADLTGTKLESR